MEGPIPKIILSKPKLLVDVKCPKCKGYDAVALQNVDVTCKNCNTRFTTEAGINIYYSMAKKIISVLSNHNEVFILGTRDTSMVFTPQKELSPRSRYETDIWHTVLAIQNDFKKQKCWMVSEISNEVEIDYRTVCNDCGQCWDCITCNKCGNIYTPKKEKVCEKCGSKSYKPTFIKKVVEKKGKKVCPHCGSSNIRKTSFSSDKKTCPRCKSRNIATPKKIPVYKLSIKRQRRFEIDD